MTHVRSRRVPPIELTEGIELRPNLILERLGEVA
jgi:hypothetical protein